MATKKPSNSANVAGLRKLFVQVKTDDWLSKLIDTFQDKLEPERWGNPSPNIHPSSSGSPCARDIELSMLGYRTAMKAQNRRRADNGTYAHNRWEKYLGDMGILKAAEVRIKSENPPFSGMCDLLIERPMDGAILIGEIKTMNQRRFQKVPAQNEDKTLMLKQLLATEKGYVYQLVMYVVMMKEEFGTSDECFFLFEDTDTQQFKIRYGIPDEALKKEAFANSLIAQEYYAKRELAPPPFERKSETCLKCYKRSMCLKLQDKDEVSTQNLQSALASI